MEPLWGHVTFDNVTSGSHATSGHAQWCIYSKKKAREPVAQAHAITSGHAPSSSGSSSSNASLAVPIYYLLTTSNHNCSAIKLLVATNSLILKR